jgi:hypothetical protein
MLSVAKKKEGAGGGVMARQMTVKVRMDTPLLQGGPIQLLEEGAGKGWKLETRLRESQIKGLLHTFARALFLPLFGGNMQMAKHAERLLLGAPAGTTWRKNHEEQEYGKVLSIETSGPDSVETKTYPNRPGDRSKGERQGLQPGGTCTITIRLMPWVPEPEAHLKALWGVLWTGLCFGGIGIRSRRGYGGLTPTDLDIQLSAAGQGNGPGLPLFSTLPKDGQVLAEQLSNGFATAQDLVRGWIKTQGANELELAPAFQLGKDPFQIKDVTQVFIGQVEKESSNTWEAVMIKLMNASSEQLRINFQIHQTIIGSANPRLASPVWLRIFKTKIGYVPVITLGSSETFDSNGSPKPIVQALLNSVNAKPISPSIPRSAPKGATL